MKPNLKKGLQEAFEPPVPERKKEFFRTLPQPKISNLSFMQAQIAYIPKHVWIIFSLTFGIVLVGGCFMEQDVLWIASALLPFVALSALSVNARSGIYMMSELEMTARFSLKSVILARMGILGLTHLFLLLFLISVCATYNSASLFQTGLYLLVPYTLIATIGLEVTRKTNGAETMYLCIGAAIGVSSISIFAHNFFPVVYGMRYTAVWLIVLVVLIILAIREMSRNIKQTEELAWNLS